MIELLFVGNVVLTCDTLLSTRLHAANACYDKLYALVDHWDGADGIFVSLEQHVEQHFVHNWQHFSSIADGDEATDDDDVGNDAFS